MSVKFFCPNPGDDFHQWASLLKEELSSYNVPNPAKEDLWLDWAVQVFAVPELVEVGVPDPRAFTSWKEWAAYLLQVSN